MRANVDTHRQQRIWGVSTWPDSLTSPAGHLAADRAREPSTRQNEHDQLVMSNDCEQPCSRVEDELSDRKCEVRAPQSLKSDNSFDAQHTVYPPTVPLLTSRPSPAKLVMRTSFPNATSKSLSRMAMRALIDAGVPSAEGSLSTRSQLSSVELDAGGTKIACERSASMENGSLAVMMEHPVAGLACALAVLTGGKIQKQRMKSMLKVGTGELVICCR